MLDAGRNNTHQYRADYSSNGAGLAYIISRLCDSTITYRRAAYE